MVSSPLNAAAYSVSYCGLRYTWLFCQKFDVDNQNAPALPFDETTVGAFIEEKSKGDNLRKSGLAHLKPTSQTSGKVPQSRGNTKTTTPVWARRGETTLKGPVKPPRRNIVPAAGQALMGLPPMRRKPAAQSGVAGQLPSESRLGYTFNTQIAHPMQQPRSNPRPPPMPMCQPMPVFEGLDRREDRALLRPALMSTINVPVPTGRPASTLGHLAMPSTKAPPEYHHNMQAPHHLPFNHAQSFAGPSAVPHNGMQP